MTCPHCGRDDCYEGWQCEKAPKAKAKDHRRIEAERPTQPELPMSLEVPDLMRRTMQHIGDGSFIALDAEIRRPHLARIGKRTNIDHGFLCTTALHVGDYCHIAPYVTVIGGEHGLLEMGHFSTIGAGSRVVCASDAGDDGLTGPTIPAEAHATVDVRPVRLEPMAIVTTGVTLLPGVTLGMGCMVGAGAVVTKDVPAWTVVAGIPARFVRARARDKVLAAARKLGYMFDA